MSAPMTFPQLDEMVAAIERRWGPDRLPRLVSPATQAKFQKAQAIQAGHAPLWPGGTLADVPGMLARAWQAMETEALAAGLEPLPDGCFECPGADEAQGAVVICRDVEHAQTLQLRAKAEGRKIQTFTRHELGLVLTGESAVTLFAKAAKAAWPGATVVRKGPPLPKDEVPFGAWGAGDKPTEEQVA